MHADSVMMYCVPPLQHILWLERDAVVPFFKRLFVSQANFSNLEPPF